MEGACDEGHDSWRPQFGPSHSPSSSPYGSASFSLTEMFSCSCCAQFVGLSLLDDGLKVMAPNCQQAGAGTLATEMVSEEGPESVQLGTVVLDCEPSGPRHTLASSCLNQTIGT